MSSPVSRRTVAKGAAWSVPIVAVGAAAPAMAASGCTFITAVSGTHQNGSGVVTLTITMQGIGAQITYFSATAGGANNSVDLSYPGAGTSQSASGSTITLVVATTDNGQNNKGSFNGTFMYTVTGGGQCSQPFLFNVATA